MTDGNSERAIGRLEGKVETLIDAVAAQTQKAEQRSARIYDELEQSRLEAEKTRRDIAELKSRLDADAPTIAEIKKWRERLIGMQIMWSVIAAAIGGGIVAIWKWITVKFGL